MNFFHQQFSTELVIQTLFYTLETHGKIVVAILHWMPTSGCSAQELLLSPAVTEELITWGVGVYAE